MGLRVIGIEFERTAARRHGFVELTLAGQCSAEIGKSGRIVRMEHEGLANPLHGEVVSAGLVGDDTKEMPGFGMVGLHGQDLAVECLGIRQPSGLMMLESKFEGLLSGHRCGEGFPAHQRCHMVR